MKKGNIFETCLFVAMVLMACFKPAQVDEAVVRSALDVLADVVSPSSKLATDGCDAKERLIVKQVREDPAITAEDGIAEVARVRARCDAVRRGFDAIRDLHEQAVEFVEAGRIEQAKAKVEEARGVFRTLQARLGGP